MIDYYTFKTVEGIEKTGNLSAKVYAFDANNERYIPIPIQKCTEDDKRKFYKPSKVYKNSFDLIFSELYCITSPEKLVFNGDFNGDLGTGLRLSFDECDSRTNRDCLSKDKKKELFA